MDDSINFLQNLAQADTWSETPENKLSWRPPEKPPSPTGTQSAGLPEIFSGDQLPKPYEIRRRTPLVENFCRKGEVVLLTSGSKVGKTWFLQNLGISVSEGLPFLGNETVKSNVIYLDLELDQADAVDRLYSISTAMGLKSVPKNFHLWSLRRHCYSLDAIIETLHSRLVELPPFSMLVFEPIYMVGTADDFDENSAASCTRLLVELEKIAMRSDCSLVMSHHFRKGTTGRENHIDRGSGSGVFARFPDCLVSLSPHQLEAHAIFEMTSRSQKSPEPFVINMTPPLLTLAENADPFAHRKYGERPEKEITDETVLELIVPGQMLSKQEWFAKARMEGIDQSNFETHFNSLRSSGRVTAVDRGGVAAYKLTIQ